LASGAQLWRLNQLGILREALNAEERVSADHARQLLREAAVRGLWAPPPPRRYMPVGKKCLATPIGCRLANPRSANRDSRYSGE
jgi:hypothetical protein